jgi:4a-hydroxytetrahydrobiopterin dehydratase
MNELHERRCAPCEGGIPPLSPDQCRKYQAKLAPGWTLSDDMKFLSRDFRFKDFYRTMSFVNALAHIANVEDHHPDLELGYNYCRVRWNTHAIGGLSDNDFICAAKVDRIELS